MVTARGRSLLLVLLLTASAVACQALLEFPQKESPQIEAGALPAEGGADGAAAAADGAAVFECPIDPNVRCTTFEDEARRQGTFEPVETQNASVGYDVADAGGHGRSMHVVTTQLPARASFGADLGLPSHVHCELLWWMENKSVDLDRMALLMVILGGTDAVHLDIVGNGNAGLLASGQDRPLLGALPRWNRVSIELDNTVAPSTMFVTAKLNDAGPVTASVARSSDVTNVRVAVGPDSEAAGWNVWFDDVICRAEP